MTVSKKDANWVQPPLLPVRYHMIITNRSKQALDPDKYRRWPTSRPSNYFPMLKVDSKRVWRLWDKD